MDFSLSEEQTLLQDSVSKYLGNDYTFAERRRIAASETGFSREQWASFAEFGWLSVPFAESVGGYGGRIEDTAVLFEAFGRALVIEPYLANVCLAGQLLARAGKDNDVAAVIGGTRHFALAGLERQSRQNYHDIVTTAQPHADGFVLNGHKAMVMNGHVADTLIVTARNGGQQRDVDGISLFIVGAQTSGVSRQNLGMMDGSRVANINLSDVVVTQNALLGELGQAWSLLEPVLLEARIAVCAEMLGIIDTLCKKVVEYSRTRSQFGVPIGSFQALQHRMVDMLMAVEQSRSIVYRAVCEYQQGEPSARTTIAAMKALLAKHARTVGEEAIQLHGGMGMTDELDIGHYVKRLMQLNQLFGDGDASVREFCALAYA